MTLHVFISTCMLMFAPACGTADPDEADHADSATPDGTTQPAGTVSPSASPSPGAETASPECSGLPRNDEACDHIDNDCDGEVDEGSVRYYPDQDHDGYGDSSTWECAPREGYVTLYGDCDDADASTHPGAQEICNFKDDDCDEKIDEEVRYYPDQDHDTYGAMGAYSCEPIEPSAGRDGDCDDGDPQIYPYATERCNGRDDDCDAKVDEGITKWYPDADGDRYGANISGSCAEIAGYVTISGDCDDANPAVNPLACEVCDLIDNNCTDGVDEYYYHYYPDADHDGYGDPAGKSCSRKSGYVDESGDCDDTDPLVYRGARERCDGKDGDCDGQIDDDAQLYAPDADGDGFGVSGTGSCSPNSAGAVVGGDCDDTTTSAYPQAAEVCDHLDNDCDGAVDEETLRYYPDADGDGYGRLDPFSSSSWLCAPQVGLVTTSTDCDDANPAINPGATETCDGIDNNCDGNGDPSVPFYVDGDYDGYGGSTAYGKGCAPPPGRSTRNDDCDDADPATWPGALEACDFVDNDCDPDTPIDLQVYFPDADMDGYGRPGGAWVGCDPPSGWSLRSGDCDDNEPTAYVSSIEVCDGIDNDCDGLIDDDLPRWFRDSDGDGFGESDPSAVTSTGPEGDCRGLTGFVEARGDCDDADPATHPGADDPADGLDQDCGGTTGPDPHVGLSAGGQASIQEALDAASDGSTVWVGPGTWKEHDLSFRGRAIALRATHRPERTVIDAAGLGRVVTFDREEGAATLLDGFTLTGGAGEVMGGGILVKGSSPTISGCIVRKNTSEGMGGGLHVEGGAPRLRGCSFQDNHAIYSCSESSAMIVAGCYDSGTIYGTWTYSKSCGSGAAHQAGGGISAKDATLMLEDSRVINNRAGGACGESYTSEGAMHYPDTTTKYTFCYGGYGGGIYTVGSTLSLTRTYVASNEATAGGGIWSESGEVLLSDTVLQYNYADGTASYREESEYYGGDGFSWTTSTDANGPGGAIAAQASTVALERVQLRNNRALGHGGGLYLVGSDVHLEQLVISGSTSRAASSYSTYYCDPTPMDDYCSTSGYDAIPSSGGGIFASDSSLVMASSVLTGNSATGSGGGLAMLGSATISDSVLSGNRLTQVCDSDSMWVNSSPYYFPVTTSTCAPTGGGGVALEGSDLAVIRTILSGNSALLGGGLNVAGSAPLLEDLFVTGNQAAGSAAEVDTANYEESEERWDPGRGGGIYLADSNARLTRLVLASNQAEHGCTSSDWQATTCQGGIGGGIFITGGGPAMTQLALIDNRAFDGGAMALYSSSPQIEHVVAARNRLLPACTGSDSSSCASGMAGGISLGDAGALSGLSMRHSVLAYNEAYNVYATTGGTAPGLAWTDLYNPGRTSHNLEGSSSTVLSVEPGFLRYVDAEGSLCDAGSSLECLPVDLHLALSSLLVDAGDPSRTDADESPADLGIYGGLEGSGWDRDHDGTYDWFWPGRIEDAPDGFDPLAWDCNDMSPGVLASGPDCPTS